MKRFIVTGITGFVGSHLSCWLIKTYPELAIVGLTRKAIQSPEDLSLNQRIACDYHQVSVSDYLTKVEHIQRDIGQDQLPKLPQEFHNNQGMFHAAAQISNKKGIAAMEASNEQGTLNAIRLSQEYASATFVYFSSIVAHHQPLAHLPYFYTKSQAEQMVKEQLSNYQILIPGVILGAGDMFKETRSFYRAFLDKPIPLLPPGSSSITDVHDLCRLAIKLAEDEQQQQVYFVGHMIAELADVFREMYQHARHWRPLFRAPKLSWPDYYARACQDYNYPDQVPSHLRDWTPLSLEELVKESAEAYRKFQKQY